jgi:hypothetical protein
MDNPQPPENLNQWAAEHGITRSLATPSVRAGEPCPCCERTPWVVLTATALAISAAVWWF